MITKRKAQDSMKRITVGILAHVDAGKTTLSEGLLFSAGEIRKLGRVDTQDTFLDTDEMERRHGITIFSKQAVFSLDDTVFTLLDTPGHVDFSAEMERTLQVLDYAILLISATDGIQGHTQTLWDLLKKHNIPTFLFINKLDLAGADKHAVIEELQKSFDTNIVDFTEEKELLNENLAMCDEALMHAYLQHNTIEQTSLVPLIKQRRLFPCFSGSALKMEGVEPFLKAFDALTEQSCPMTEFGAKVFKINQDEKGQRLTFLKITGGNLKVKDLVQTGEDFTEKVNEIRAYSGSKYQSISAAESGSVCAVTGLAHTYAGQGLGFETNAEELTAEPIFTYRVILPQNVDAATALKYLRVLEQEETKLSVVWNEQLKEIQLRLMGEIQLKVLKQLIAKRFGIEVAFAEGRIVYKETIENKVEGVGHYEPLRHYAEVHLLLEPLPRGSGVQFASDCSEDFLDKNWQRLIMTHLMEKTHIGVLTGSPITDVKITLKSGKAHLKHTEGGDFRQATYRAVRHGLRCAKSVLLEPYYAFTLEVPSENVGKAMTDLDRFGAQLSLPQTKGDTTKISGTVAADAIRNYQKDLVDYTHGRGKLSCKFSGYGPCRNPEAVIEEIGYDCDSDMENTADSVFCAHGAGFHVPWDEVTEHMHLDSVLKRKVQEHTDVPVRHNGSIGASDEELLKIFEKTYGKVERKLPTQALRTAKPVKAPKVRTAPEQKKEYLLIDGYNIIFAWDDLKEIAKDNLEDARVKLTEKMLVYRIFRGCELILVFDAYKVKGNRGEMEQTGGITVIYTKESQTADAYIEKAARELSKNYRVTVATSDALEQLIIFGTGAYRMPASHLKDDYIRMEAHIRSLMDEYKTEAETGDFIRTIEDRIEEK